MAEPSKKSGAEMGRLATQIAGHKATLRGGCARKGDVPPPVQSMKQKSFFCGYTAHLLVLQLN